MSNVRGRKPAFEWVGCDLDALEMGGGIAFPSMTCAEESARPSAPGRGSKKSNSENIAPAGMLHVVRLGGPLNSLRG